jgi:hypothetical protein
MRTLASASTLFAIATLTSTLSVAQAENAPTAGEPAAAPTTETVPSPPADARLEAIEKKVTDLQEQNKNLAEQVAELQESQAQGSAEPPSDLGKTKVFGFFATSFAKVDWGKKDSALKLVIPIGDNSTFLLTSLNVYLANQITQHLKFLAELRFTYQPLGTETSQEAHYVLPDGSKVDLGSKYERTDTTVRDPSSIQQYRLGGVSMERVQATYTINDYLGVTVGRFLTPLGIWNVDHGAPVILTTRAPAMQTQEIAPLQQLGIQVFGKAFLAGGLSLDYAGTLSNGRGPMDALMDLDDNKAVGLRWRLNYDTDDFSASLGQYGYTGKYTDTSKTVYVGPGSADCSVVTNTTNQYTEYVLANDLLIKLYGLRLQSEAVLRRVKYQTSPVISPQDFNGNPALAGNYRSPSFDARAIYGLVAYELPESLTTGKLRVTPFVYGERFILNDASLNNNQGTVYAGGLNIKPYTSTVLKLEMDRVKFDDLVDLMPDGTTKSQSTGVMTVYTVQLALTF